MLKNQTTQRHRALRHDSSAERESVRVERDWQHLSPARENTELGPMIVVGIFFFCVAFGFVAMLWKFHEGRLASMPACFTFGAAPTENHTGVRSKSSNQNGHSQRLAKHNDKAATPDYAALAGHTSSTATAATASAATSSGTQPEQVVETANTTGGVSVDAEHAKDLDASEQVAILPPSLAPLKTAEAERQSARAVLPSAAADKVHQDKVSRTRDHESVDSGRSDKTALVFNQQEHRIIGPNLLIKCSDNASLRVEKNGLLVLREGDIVVDTKKPFLIKAGSSRVLLKNSSTILVSVNDGNVKVRNLQEQHACSTQVFFGLRRFELRAGEELVSARSFDQLGALASSDGVKRRQIHTFDLDDGTNILCDEFSAVNVIKKTPVLKSLISSSNRYDEKAYGKVMKMAACLAIVTAGHGQYTSVTPVQNAAIASADLSN